MSSFATLPPVDRRELLEAYELRFGVSAVVAEKDFWVVWLLARIFGAEELGMKAVFKGGTSLSKVFGAINRFSEDIDLGIDPASLGWTEQELTDSSQSHWTKHQRPDLESACGREVEAFWLPRLEKAVSERLGEKSENRPWLRYGLEDISRSPTIYFDYPGALTGGVSYIARSVKLEFGSAPREFSDMGAEVIALEIERTFWEKATILHAEYHRPSEKVHPARYARHYADFAALWRHDSKERSAARVDLLHRVRNHKAKFFASGWAHYHTAELGTLRLLPAAARLDELRRDYAAMLPMFMGEPRPFDEVLEIIGEAEQSLNAMKG